jgi:D-xylose transport system substrate-binding protein
MRLDEERAPMKYLRILAGMGALTVVAACGSSSTSNSSGGASRPVSGKIALLLPETKTARYEASDRPDITARLRTLGYDTSQLIYDNANQDASTQQNQADAAITNGAKVMILDPVDSVAAAAIATKAAAAGVPVIAYDRLIKGSAGVTAYVSFDNVRVGELQARSLVGVLTTAGRTSPHIVMINGSPTDANAASFRKGAHNVFDPLVSSGRLTIDKEYDTPDWSPDQAQNEMQQALTALGGKVDGVYCANDGTAGGAIAALEAANVSPLPPVTGQDAEVAGVQRVLAGDQYMTIYKAVQPEAALAAQAAVDLLSGRRPSGFDARTNNGSIDVPSRLLNPVAVTRSTVKDTIIADHFHTVAELCTAQYAQACQAAGIR